MSIVAHQVVQRDLARITSLPSRPPIDCERDAKRRWAPQAQALVEVMTEKFTRGPRLSCGCRKRVVVIGQGGRITIAHTPSPGAPPQVPLETTIADFCTDNAHDPQVCNAVLQARAGQTVELPGLDALYCMTQLNPVQAWILRELPIAHGIHGLVSVGGGKTAAGVLAPLAMPPHVKTIVLLAKPDQRIHYRNAYLRLREHFRVPSMMFDGALDGSFIVPGTPVMHFIPYSRLSRPDATQLLEQKNPDAVIADESHLLAARSSARTLRFLRLMAKRSDIIFCDWSGSTIKKSIKDASHLAAHALGLGSPYPILPDEVDRWAAVIDPSHMMDLKSPTAAELYMNFAGIDIHSEKDGVRFLYGARDTERLRAAFRERVIHTPGVISTVSSSINCSVSINEREAPKVPQSVKDALAVVRDDGVRPDGEVLVLPLDVITCARNIGCGFYEKWFFPRNEDPALIIEWKAARKAWNKAVRTKIALGETHLDSPMLCYNAAERAWRTPAYEGDLPVWREPSFLAWREIEDKVKPDPRVVWIDDYLAKDAAAWAKENVGIVWCESRALGLKIAQLAGLHYHAGGANAEAEILAEDGTRSVVASIVAHGTGRDQLQHRFSKQLIVEVPSSSDRWEQLLGRLAREGQQADTVETEVYLHVAEIRDAMRKAINYAQYVEATTPNRQLILAADIGFDL